MLYFAVATLGVDGGIQVTGSHNPADYNGFKMLLNGRSVFGEEIQELGRRAADGDWSEGQGKVEEVDVARRLCRPAGRRTFRAATFRIGWDAGNGAAGPALEKLIARCPASITRSTPKSTAPSPTTIPIPTVEANLADLKALVAEKKLDFGIAFDGDGDRIGAVDGEGPRRLGRPIADDPRRAGAEGTAGRDDHRRRQGQPDPVRPHRRRSAARR